MNDLISRQAAIDAWKEDFKGFVNSLDVPRDDYKGIMEYIDELPSADRPQGEWVRTGRTNIYGGIEVQCSNCGDMVMVQHLEDEWYCRHCGADMGMKGADDE